MKARILAAPATPELTPLANRTPPGQLRIAGDTLRGWQEKRLELAGFELVEGDRDEDDRHNGSNRDGDSCSNSGSGAKSTKTDELRISECAWLHDEALARILLESRPLTVLADGDLAADDGFFVRYAWDFLRLNEEIVESLAENIILGEVDRRATIEGHLSLGEGTRILPGVYIEGNVVIGRNCKIGPNCHIRGKTSIGDHCHIGQSVEVKNSIIMSHSNVGHLSYVGDSVLAPHVNLGAGTIISNLRHDGANQVSRIGDRLVDTGRRKFGSIIGEGARTGIHTSIYPGRKIAAAGMTLPGDIVRKDID